MPFSDNVSLHGPVIHEISPHGGSAVIGGRRPTQHHAVLDSLEQGHTGGFSRDGCEGKLTRIVAVLLTKELTPTQQSGLRHALHTPDSSLQKTLNIIDDVLTRTARSGRMLALQTSPTSSGDWLESCSLERKI